jgi:hypothetical protein
MKATMLSAKAKARWRKLMSEAEDRVLWESAGTLWRREHPASMREVDDEETAARIFDTEARRIVKEIDNGRRHRDNLDDVNAPKVEAKEESDKEIRRTADRFAREHPEKSRALIVAMVLSHYKHDAKVKWKEGKVRKALIGWRPKPPR